MAFEWAAPISTRGRSIPSVQYLGVFFISRGLLGLICDFGAYPTLTWKTGNFGGRKRSLCNLLTVLDKLGAGERIRTVDPNLGKVMLYP